MAVKAFVLINTVPNATEKVVRNLQELRGVKEIASVTGKADVVLKLEAPDFDELKNILLKKVRQLEGVYTTETLIAVE